MATLYTTGCTRITVDAGKRTPLLFFFPILGCNKSSEILGYLPVYV